MGNPAWRFEGNERRYLEEVLSSGFRAGADGSFSTRLEGMWADMHGAPYAIAANSGTSSLHAALLGLGCGPGDEVLVPALTPLMCGLTPHYTGATPVLRGFGFGHLSDGSGRLGEQDHLCVQGHHGRAHVRWRL